MNIDTIRNVYFVGIGGIGMSALARYFLSKGRFVAGYDRVPCALTRQLEAEGASVHYTEDVHLIPTACMNPADTLVIYTPAIPAQHAEWVYFREHHFEVMKRAQVLGLLTRQAKGLCVAGTHGKTTTSTMIAHLLQQTTDGCNAFLGGISKNYHTNLLLSATSDYIVIEADEFDRSFHWLTPYISVVTATDADHLDIYGTHEAYLESFAHYTSLIQPGGALIVHEGLQLQPRLQAGVRLYTYGRESGDFHAEHIRVGGGEIVFDWVSPWGSIRDVSLGVPVSINIENGIAAMAVAWMSGVEVATIKTGMASFNGVERRFDIQVKTSRHVFVNDYAHHPEELRQSILSLRTLYAGKPLTGVFQPHLYTRTRDFYQEFADSLSLLDEVILLDIYPAREEPIPGVTSQLIYDHLSPAVTKSLCTQEQLVEVLRGKHPEVLITLGAGDLDNLVPAIRDMLNEEG